MGFSENLKKIRSEKGISQQELAKKIGVSQTAIYQWEKGTRTPKIDAIAKLANALAVPPIQLFTVEENGEQIIELSNPHMSMENIEDYLNVILPEYLEECRKEGNLFNSIDNKNIILEKMELLNNDGQKKAIEQVELLTKVPEYQKKPDE